MKRLLGHEKILLIAPLIYFVYGMTRFSFITESSLLSHYSITLVVQLFVIILYFLVSKENKNIDLNFALIPIYLTAMINEHILGMMHDYRLVDLTSITILTVAITYTFWMKSFIINLGLNITGFIAFIYAFTSSAFVERPYYIIVCFFFLSLWKAVNDYYIQKYHIAKEKENKLKAYKETVGLLNHEFNNISNIALMILKRKKKEIPLIKEEEELEKVMTKISKLVRNLKDIEEYDSEEYTQGVNIAKLKNHDQDLN